jgi:hypothetical protein
MNYYIKTTNEATLWVALESANLAFKEYDREDPLNTRTDNLDLDWVPCGAFEWVAKCQLDIIGTIQKPTGQTAEINGFTVPVMVNIEGFHANVMANLTQEQKEMLPLIEAPATPVRVWA